MKNIRMIHLNRGRTGKPEGPTDRETLAWLNRAVPQIRLQILLLTAVRIFSALVGVCYAVSLRRIVDSAVSGSRAAMWQGVALFIVLVIFEFLLQGSGRFLDEYIRSTAENKLKLRLTHHLLQGDYSRVTAVHSGEWMNRLTSDTAVVAGAAAQILPGLAGMITRMVASAGMLLVLLPRLTLILLAGGSLVAAGTLWMRRILKRMHRQIQESDGRLRIFLTERLGSLMILKAYQQEQTAEESASGLMDRHRAAKMKKSWFSNFCNTGFTLAMNSAFVLAAAMCGLGILNGSVSYGTFSAVIQLVSQLQSPIAGLTGFAPQYYTMLASAERLQEAETFCGAQKPEEPAECGEFQGFGLENVSYTYQDEASGGRVALNGLSLQVKKGEQVAFSGPSGCGKSTVLKLLLCLFEPDAGRRYVMTAEGETPLTRAWGRLFAYVPQGNHLMSGTIRQVVSFSRPDQAGDDEAIRRALDIACAGEFVEQLPEGLDTVLGERGSGLSEGQMQRLAVARALFSQRPVLLLDEATSALDGPSEVRMLENIRAMTEKTVIIVTHRPAALDLADKIVRFSEKGTEIC